MGSGGGGIRGQLYTVYVLAHARSDPSRPVWEGEMEASVIGLQP